MKLIYNPLIVFFLLTTSNFLHSYEFYSTHPTAKIELPDNFSQPKKNYLDNLHFKAKHLKNMIQRNTTPLPHNHIHPIISKQ